MLGGFSPLCNSPLIFTLCKYLLDLESKTRRQGLLLHCSDKHVHSCSNASRNSGLRLVDPLCWLKVANFRENWQTRGSCGLFSEAITPIPVAQNMAGAV